MSINRKAPLFVVVVAIWLAGMPGSPSVVSATPRAQATTADPLEFGVVIRDPWYEFGTDGRYPGQPNYEALDRMGRELAATGARWVRLEFIYQLGAGTFDEQIARNDYFVNEVAPRYNLKVLGLLAFRLVDVDPRDASERGLISNVYKTSPYGIGVNQYMEEWLNRALSIMTRYEGKVAAYEVFNEPNRLAVAPKTDTHPGYGGGEGIHPERLAALHTKLYRCFKQNTCAYASAAPGWRAGVKLIVGGLHPRGSDKLVGQLTGPDVTRPVNDRDYLASFFTSAAFKSYYASSSTLPVDGVGYHPYPAEIITSLASIDDELSRIEGRLGEVRKKLDSAVQSVDAELDPGAPALKFWITEIGYNAAYLSQSTAGQALFLRTIFSALAARDDVMAAFWFKYEDFPPEAGSNAQRWGLVRVPFSEDKRCPGGACYAVTGEPELRRPAFWVLRELSGLPVTRLYLPLAAR